MIISHEHRFVFIHNPKVAGSAVRKAIEHLHDDEITYWHQKFIPALDRVVDAAHLTMHDLTICRPDLMGYTFFGFYRESYSRYASAFYEYCRQHHPLDNPPDLNEWTKTEFDETNFRFNWKYIHFCPQHYFNPHNYPAFANSKSLWLDYTDIANNFDYLVNEVQGLAGCTLPIVRQRPDKHKDLVSTMNQETKSRIDTFYVENDSEFTLTSNYTNHYEKINGIRSPHLKSPVFHILNSGELKAAETEQGSKTHLCDT